MEVIDILPIARHIIQWYDTHPDGYYSLTDVINDLDLRGKSGEILARQTVHNRLKSFEFGREILVRMRERRRGSLSKAGILPDGVVLVSSQMDYLEEPFQGMIQSGVLIYKNEREFIRDFEDQELQIEEWAIISDIFSLTFLKAREFWFLEITDVNAIRLHQVKGAVTTESYSTKDGLGLRYMWEEGHREIARNNSTIYSPRPIKRPKQSGTPVSDLPQYGTQ